MKLTVGLILFAMFTTNAVNSYSQNARISLNLKNATIVDIFREIERNSEFGFFFKSEEMNLEKRQSISVSDATIDEVLKKVLDENYSYKILDKNIVVTKGSLDVTQQQDKKVTGKVTDQAGEPLPGVSVVVKGTTTGVNTNNDGNFSIVLPDDAKNLIFSFVGMRTQEVIIGTKSEYNVVLVEEAVGLQEVVAVGYGTQKRREVTGSISTLSTAQTEDMPVGQITQKIQGRIAGVQINQTSGTPGSGMSIRIRGAASVNAGNNPLYVVDGFPIVGDINSINPSEIESISVLKGPSAASIYGSRAASGVVLITTKKAKQGQSNVQFSASKGIGQIPQRGRPQLMNAKEFLQYEKEIFQDKITYEGYTGGIPALYQNPEQYTGKSTNWFDVLLRNSSVSSYNLSLSTSKDKFSSATTIGYYKEDGSMLNTGYERFSLRSNNEYKVNDFIRVGLNVAPTYQTNQNFGTDGWYSLIYASLTTAPIFSPFDTNPDGSRKINFTGPGLFNEPNWYTTMTDAVNRQKLMHVLSNGFVEINFLKNFRYKSAVSVDIGNSSQRVWNPSTIGNIWSPPPHIPSGSYNSSFYTSWLTENTMSFDKTFAEDHHLEVLAGYSAQKFRQEYAGLTGTNFPDNLNSWIDAAATKSGRNFSSEWSLLSMYGRLNYNYKGKYLLSASVRRDGSSRFGSENRWGSFPSISTGWIISDEDFMKKLPVVNYLKLRAEYGLTGNFNIGNYSQFGNVSTSNYIFGNSLAQGRSLTSIGNQKLTWETTKGMDIGVDIAFLNDRIGLTMDYYQKEVSDMLYQVDIPMGSGFSNIQSNIGGFRFWGYEFSVNTKNTIGIFKWNADFNISFDRNKVIKLGTNNTPIDGIQGIFWKTEVGKPIGQFFGFVFDGVYKTQHELDTQPKYFSSSVGTVRMKDTNGDGIINSNDCTIIGNPNPKFIFGMNNSLAYKNFDLNVSIAGAYGQDIVNGQLEWSENQDGVFNVQKYLKDRWRSPENPGAGIIGKTWGNGTILGRYPNSRWIEDGSYLTLKNITLGYSIPILSKIFSRTRVYFSVQQALVLTKYKGMSPETSIYGLNGLRQGLDVSAYPVPRTFVFGFDVNL